MACENGDVVSGGLRWSPRMRESYMLSVVRLWFVFALLALSVACDDQAAEEALARSVDIDAPPSITGFRIRLTEETWFSQPSMTFSCDHPTGCVFQVSLRVLPDKPD